MILYIFQYFICLFFVGIFFIYTTFKNQPKGSLIIQKRDSQTGEVLPGAEFRITTAAGCEVGLNGVIGTSTLTQNGIFVTDAQGEIKITNLVPGAYVVTVRP